MKVFYFSGTGNSLKVAKDINNHFNGQLLRIDNQIFNNLDHEDSSICIVFPSYAYGLPLLVNRFLKKVNLKCSYLVLITTYGSSYGGTLGLASKILKKRKIKVSFTYGIKTVENFTPLFGEQKEKTISKRLSNQKIKTEECIKLIENKHTNKVFKFRLISKTIVSLFYLGKPLLTKLHKVSNDCNKCGICKRVCPNEAITITTNTISFNKKKCEQCQACFNWCPKKAIRYGRIKKNTKRYHHPEVSLEEFLS